MADNDIFNPETEEELDDLGTVSLTLDDDTEMVCSILTIYPVGDKQYIALLPLEENGVEVESNDVLIYRFIDNGDDAEPDIENIEDDDEFEAVCDRYEEVCDEEDFEEL